MLSHHLSHLIIPTHPFTYLLNYLCNDPYTYLLIYDLIYFTNCPVYLIHRHVFIYLPMDKDGCACLSTEVLQLETPH